MRQLKIVMNLLLVISTSVLILSFTIDATKKDGQKNIPTILQEGNRQVNGGGTAIEGGKVSTFVFNAVEFEDGTVTGHLVYNWRLGSIYQEMEIDCMRIAGNRATLSGVITTIRGDNSSYPFIVEGSRVSFTIEDNGNGVSGGPDKISDFIYGNTASCANYWNPYIPIKGNISINDE